ncbi:hypothetical protein QE152_g6818 [Popillia japonica]|uniref:Chitin-binding type-2 domain-containing protein n=1 Tax=Popillia japonica TaxID=7064 RepID=A0AAW1ME41_POPJA
MFSTSITTILILIIASSLFDQYTTQNCTTTGRFSIYGTNCKYYIHCTYAGGVYYSTTFYCPGTTFFSPRSQACVATFTCGDTYCDTAMTDIVNSTYADFLDPNLSDGVSYIRCARYNDTAIFPTYLTCPFTFNISSTTGNTYNQGCCPYVTC